MFTGAAWAVLALSCASIASAQSLVYHFTMSVSPAPVPGKPFTITWTGGEPDEAVYIALNNYFPPVTNQNILYGSVDILSNAPNNGSWTYNVPLNIEAARHSFSIGYNPVMLSDTSEVFTIPASETSAVPPGSGVSTTNTAFQTYNGCGLPPLPDYTYTGYQPPCTTTISGQPTILYPIVPASSSSVWYTLDKTLPPVTTPSSPAPTINTAFAGGAYAQALQCPTTVTTSTTRVTNSGTTTFISTIDCSTPFNTVPSPTSGGMCHTSGYTTFSVSGTSSVCCPSEWGTSLLAPEELFCYSTLIITEGRKIGGRQVSTETLAAGPGVSTMVGIEGVVFTTAGIVTEKAVKTGSSGTGGMSSSITGIGTGTAAGASVSETKKSDGTQLTLRTGIWALVLIMGVLCMLYV